MKNNRILAIVLVFIIISGIIFFANGIGSAAAIPSPVIEWSNTYTANGSSDSIYSCTQTSDGGYAFTLSSPQYMPAHFSLVKTNALGTEQWTQNYAIDVLILSTVQTTDGGYAFAGWKYDTSYLTDFWLGKADSSGNLQWSKSYANTGNEMAYSMIQTNDGGFALSGTTDCVGGSRDGWLVKTDSLGNLQWSRSYSQTYSDLDDAFFSIIQSSDGGYAMAGATGDSFDGNIDAWLLKTDNLGNTEWGNTYGGSGHDFARSVVQTKDGGYALAGSSRISSSNHDFFLVKTDSTGALKWNKHYGDGISDNWAYSLAQLDGGYAIGGYKYYNGNYNTCDGWLVITDISGNAQWNQTYGEQQENRIYAVIRTSDGGLLLGGHMRSSDLIAPNSYLETSVGWLVKIKPDIFVTPETPYGTTIVCFFIATGAFLGIKKKT